MSANELFTYPTYPNPTFQTTAMLSILHMYHMNFILALYKFIACFPSWVCNANQIIWITEISKCKMESATDKVLKKAGNLPLLQSRILNTQTHRLQILPIRWMTSTTNGNPGEEMETYHYIVCAFWTDNSSPFSMMSEMVPT